MFEKMKPIHRQFEQAANKFPSNLAISTRQSHIDYALLNHKANQLARALQEIFLSKYGKSLKDNHTIAVCMGREIETIVAFLAILKIGCAYVPIDPAYPPNRVAYMIQDSQSKLILTSQPYLELLHSNLDEHDHILCYEHLNLDSHDAGNLDLAVSANDLAYVIYTSGSTGNPKGVMVEHRNIHALVSAQEELIQPDSQRKFLLFYSICFDASVWSIYTALLNGASFYIACEDERQLPELMHETMIAEQITDAVIPPTVVALMPAKPIKSLRYFLVGGETTPQKVVDYWLGQTKLINVYGPTETTVFCSTHQYSLGDINTNIGKAIGGAKIFVVNEVGEPCDVNEPGELLIGGDFVARGYLHQLAMTAEKFVELSLNGSTHRVYRTGDIVKTLENGELQYMGRRDNQVKLRGYRVELDEIENKLGKILGIKQTAVNVIRSENNHQILVAYYTSETKLALPSDIIREQLSQELPEYMLPNIYMHLDEFLLTPSEKIDKNRLPLPDFSHKNKDIIKPKNNMQKSVAKIWQHNLSLPVISINENFFELGGDSLQAARIVYETNQTFNTNILVSDVYWAPTIEQLSSVVEEKQSDSSEFLYDIKHQALPERARVSLSEELVLRFEKLVKSDLERSLYNVCMAIHMEGELNDSDFKQAVFDAVARYDIYQYSYECENDLYFKVRKQKSEPFFVERELDQDEVDAFILEESSRPFKFGELDLLRIFLIKLKGQSKYLFLINQDHVLCDIISVNLLLHEIEQIYNARQMGVTPKLMQRRITYTDYAAWQHEFLQSDSMSKQIRVWSQYLADIASFAVKPDLDVAGKVDFDLKYYESIIDEELYGELRNASKLQGVSVHSMLIYGFSLLLSEYANSKTVNFIVPYVFRKMPDLENLIGCFAHHYIYKAKIDKTLTASAAIKEAFSNYATLMDNQDVPTLYLLNILMEQNKSIDEIIKYSIIYQDQAPYTPNFRNMTSHLRHIRPTKTFEDFCFELFEEPDKLMLNIQYNADKYLASTMDKIYNDYLRILRFICERPNDPISDAL